MLGVDRETPRVSQVHVIYFELLPFSIHVPQPLSLEPGGDIGQLSAVYYLAKSRLPLGSAVAQW